MCNLFLLNNYIFKIVYKMLEWKSFGKPKSLLWSFMNLIWMFYSRIWLWLSMNYYAGATSWDCMGATSLGLKCREVPRTVQSATWNLLQIEKYFGSLSVVIPILIMIVLYDIDIFMFCTSIEFLFWVCTRYSDSDRVTGIIGDIMWHELTFCFLWVCYMICFRKWLCFWNSKLLWIWKCQVSDLCNC